MNESDRILLAALIIDRIYLDIRQIVKEEIQRCLNDS